MIHEHELKDLEQFALEIRKKTLYMIGKLGVGHIGGALSIAEVLALLYGKEMHYLPENPRWEGRDLLVLSKGHAGPALYAALAIKGFFPIEWLDTLNQGGTRLPSHCDRNRTPGIDMSTGSLGQGLSAACGIALGRRLDKSAVTIFAIIGDGESNEGQNWEAAMFASHYKLSNIIAFTDYNKFQIDGSTDEIMCLGDIEGKWQSFGWYTERCNGHDIAAIHESVLQCRRQREVQGGKPSMIILDTIKGKGAAFCENKADSHNMTFNLDVANEAIAALGGN